LATTTTDARQLRHVLPGGEFDAGIRVNCVSLEMIRTLAT
jgi:hypothetical protein